MDDRHGYMTLILGISVLCLFVAFLFARHVLSQDAGTAQMQKISNAIKAGAEAFLNRQYRTIVVLAAALAVIIYLGYFFGKNDGPLAFRMTLSFALGAICSLAAGFCGMFVSIRTNIRAASACRTSLNRG
jgi:K(+)-stimulated pyrophosphate-energized sodium pump